MDHNSLQETQNILERMFHDFNKIFYDLVIETPIITIMNSSHGNTLGWCTQAKVWETSDSASQTNQSFWEINICADALDRSIYDIAETMLHEMAHLFNIQNNIKDTSRSGSYHNKKYKNTAESHSLICTQTTTYGYAKTALNPSAYEFVKLQNYSNPSISRLKSKKPASRNHYLRYICLGCKSIIRSTSPVQVLCMSCETPYIYEESRHS